MLQKYFLLIVVCFAINTAFGQKTRHQLQIKIDSINQNKSALEQFDDEFMLKEAKKKTDRIKNQQKRAHILSYIDTVSISEGLRSKLKVDLDKNPFSKRFQKFLLRLQRCVFKTKQCFNCPKQIKRQHQPNYLPVTF